VKFSTLANSNQGKKKEEENLGVPIQFIEQTRKGKGEREGFKIKQREKKGGVYNGLN